MEDSDGEGGTPEQFGKGRAFNGVDDTIFIAGAERTEYTFQNS